LPVALLEAMSAGLPAVVTDVGGMAEVARLSRAATLVPPSHPEALARALRNAARRSRELPAIGQLARDCYEAHFTPDGMNAQYLRLYSQPRRHEQ
jgi:glycosyltransferase involved in cell wall biosynthesis